MKFKTLVWHCECLLAGQPLFYSRPIRVGIFLFFVNKPTLWLVISLIFRVPTTLSPESEQPDRKVDL
jgi:hypothetical protein